MSPDPSLVVLSSGQRIPLREGLTLGRGTDCDIRLEDGSVSSRHAAFRRIGAGWIVQDLNATNGTWLQGERVVGSAPLQEGDTLGLGAMLLRVEGLQPEGTTAFPPPLLPPPPPLPPAFPPPLPQAVPPPLPTQAYQPPPIPAAAWRPPQVPPPTQKRGGRGWLWILAALLLGGLGALGWVLKDRFLGGSETPVKALVTFRQEAEAGAPGAFTRVQAPLQRLRDLNQTLFPTAEPAAGWAYHFGHSLVAPGGINGRRQAVLFYNPWSDVGLVTVWEGETRITDLEAIPGEALRNGGKAPLGGVPGWMRPQAYGPFAVGHATAQTVKAFETAFAQQTDLELALPWLASGNAREGCRVACALQFAQVLKSLVDFSAAADVPARIAFIRMLAEGKAALQGASATPPESEAALRKLPAGAWACFRPTVMVKTGDKVLVMAHHKTQPDLFLGVVLHPAEDGLRPERLDLLSFNGCYGAQK